MNVKRMFCFMGWLAGVAAYGQETSAITITDLTWHDEARNRDVPVRMYLPKAGNGPFPVIIFSHGLGGSREGYAYLGRYWSSHGYVSVHVQHLGSDTDALKGAGNVLQALGGAMASPDNLVNRPRDISFAIDQVTLLNQRPGPWQGRFDLSRIGVAGHSFGAYTTLAIAGETYPIGTGGLTDPRVKAIVAMSAPVSNRPGSLHGDCRSIHIPALHMTGTEDKLLPADRVESRRIPYDESPGPDTYLVIFQGGDHMVFSGAKRLVEEKGRNDSRIHDLVCQASTAFWDAYLKGDARAKNWLAGGGFTQALGFGGTFEKK